MIRILLTALLAACSVDNELQGKNDDAGFDTGDPVTFPTEDTDTTAPIDEDCNGLDDNGDGNVDEGYPDDDGDGLANCMEQDCPQPNAGDAGSVEMVEECQGTTGSGGGEEVDDPWNVQVKWTWGAGKNSWFTPVIGNLDDDDGDGDVDENDSPEVVLSLSNNTVVAIDGATGIEKWTKSGTNGYGSVIIADVDADGYPDVVAANTQGQTYALEGDGTDKWVADDRLTSLNYMMFNVADLDEDGWPEVLHDNTVLDGRTGDVLFDLEATSGGGWIYRIAGVGDVDNDGDQEIALEGALFDSDGDLIWDSGEVGTYGFWPVLINADEDDEAEIGFVGKNWSLYEHDGTEIYSTTYNTTAQPGPPCAADFDGDGVAEVAWPAYQNFVMYEMDGTQVWSVPMDDTSGLAGCSGYDLNNDGALEVLFADQSSFTIFDGATGRELFTDTTHASPTIFEYPTVADIDADGHAEIVVAHYGASSAVTVYEHAGDGWPAAGTTWNVHDFAITNINPDGSVPQNPEASWLKYNVYRARVAADDPSTPDLVASVTDVCVADCDYGPVEVSVQVANQGGADVSDGQAYVSLWTIEDTPREIASQALPAVAAGEKLAGITFELDPSDVGERGFEVRVDDGEAVSECDETNNTDEWREVYCP
ncbi:MAG: FG-GAP-like repeat-containing protein [Myxococcota bacterium]